MIQVANGVHCGSDHCRLGFHRGKILLVLLFIIVEYAQSQAAPSGANYGMKASKQCSNFDMTVACSVYTYSWDLTC